MGEEVDFSMFASAEEALDAWLQPSLSLRIGVNMPAASCPSPAPSPRPILILRQEPAIPIIPQPSPGNNQDDHGVVDHHRYHQAGRPRQGPAEGMDEPINPAFPWATDRRAQVHTLDHLIANGQTSIRGEVQCRRCERREKVTVDLRSRFREVEGFVRERLGTMYERAAAEWMNPVFARCGGCRQPNCMRPVLAADPSGHNWLFLFLGQSLGMLTLKDIKWFCKYTSSNRSGAKDRLLYLTYMAIGKQLDPTSEIFIRPSADSAD